MSLVYRETSIYKEGPGKSNAAAIQNETPFREIAAVD